MKMVDCLNYEQNSKICPCSYSSCSRKGICCECIKHHRERNELPACYFPPEIEVLYDRSIEKFISMDK